MDKLIELYNQAQALIAAMGEQLTEVVQESNQATLAYNELVEYVEAEEALKKHESENAKKAVSELMTQRDIAIEAFEKKSLELSNLKNNLNETNKVNKELMALDPKRLVKVNKQYQVTISELKATVKELEESRREAIHQHKLMLKQNQEAGTTNLHVYENGNSLRFAPSVRVRKGNDFDGVAETPVIEFFHQKCGVMRLGTLLNDGTIGWSSAANSMPTTEESSMAMFKIHEYCDARKIRYPKKA